MKDYILVGLGIAGISFAEVLLQHQKSFIVISDDSQKTSQVAAGLYNPIILKRFSEVWKAQEQLDLLDIFYENLERKLQIKINVKIPIFRKIASIEEQNNWFIAADKPLLAPFLSTQISNKKYQGIESPFGYGEVLKTGYVDTRNLLPAYHLYLTSINMLQEETFDHDILKIYDNYVEYKGIKAKHIVFAEGYGMLSNPYFRTLPLDGTKGELLVIKVPQLSLDVIIKSRVFMLPLGNFLYMVGATYDWVDKTDGPTNKGKKELIDNVKELISYDFEIVEHQAAIRPTVKDRRPLVGTHTNYKNMHVLNGLGTRGIMLGPAMANKLFEFIEWNKPLDKQVNINRFY